jgi:hypothetical protein
MNWSARRELLPLKVLFLIGYAFFVAVVLITSEHDERSIIGVAVGGVFVISLTTGLIALFRRRDRRIAGAEDWDAWVTVVRALSTGDAPANTSFDEGLRALAAKRRTDLRRIPWLVIALTLLVLAETLLSPDAGLIALTCVFGLLNVLTWMDRVRGSRRLARLTEALRSRQAPESP